MPLPAACFRCYWYAIFSHYAIAVSEDCHDAIISLILPPLTAPRLIASYADFDCLAMAFACHAAAEIHHYGALPPLYYDAMIISLTLSWAIFAYRQIFRHYCQPPTPDSRCCRRFDDYCRFHAIVADCWLFWFFIQIRLRYAILMLILLPRMPLMPALHWWLLLSLRRRHFAAIILLLCRASYYDIMMPFYCSLRHFIADLRISALFSHTRWCTLLRYWLWYWYCRWCHIAAYYAYALH